MLRVGYVPEHFAAPLLHLGATPWGKENIELVLQPSGTGQMLTSLDAAQQGGQKIDVAVALTEALIAGIAKGRQDYRLVGSYVRTSLNWAVITGTDPAASAYQSISDLAGQKIGISRIGSGSQIMASVMALQHNWTDDEGQVRDIEFLVNDTFANLRAGVNQKPPYTSAAFMWEWYTTKPYVDSGEVRFIGNVPTPWPSWTIAASLNTALDPSHPSSKLLDEFQRRLTDEIRKFANPHTRQSGQAKDWIVQHHDYKPGDVATWLDGVRWAGEETPNPPSSSITEGQNTTPQTVSQQVVSSTLDVLEKAGVVKRPHDGWQMQSFIQGGSAVE
ncbi:uncharacterized protein PFL1_06285 [Pseudozyma flocculosa PF-1]|uniref:Ca3427-like PBP 2 domain-containing protein n=2 Tax=Pseudozyma flocculosa TaxID=84751 RepID=A0A5C3FA80_9BASI|nr:uncharacterized protein PFL1_06285 [Pseudozyma flocculosa PF-1]EPQ26077.1 hypothetical protein PFL1_06285 [Pseudozyma flocculosa PF-1]SPO40321.1 uncharacterized protein PSFLO_05803 [Pseudozyma flocculosa]